MTTTGRLQTFAMPDVGEGLTEAEVLDWRVAVGDMLSVNQVMVEIETAKAAVELPSPFAGRVHALLVEPGVTVFVGTAIITVDTDPDAGELPQNEPAGSNGAAASSPGSPTPAPVNAPADGNNAGAGGAKIGEAGADGRIATLVGYVSVGASTARRPRRAAPGTNQAESAATGPRPSQVQETVAPSLDVPSQAPLATPPVRKLAKDLGIDLATVTPTRPDGVISRADIENLPSSGDLDQSPARSAAPEYDRPAREQHIPLKGVRKATAAAMVASAFSAPHVTEFLTVDVTPMMELRSRLRRRPEFADIRLTPLAFTARAVCLAVRRTPELNSVFDDAAGEIVVKHYVNLGIAAATPRGLIVPVIRDADALDLAGLAGALSDLGATARAGRTPPSAMTGGTFSITNVGVFGIDTGTPIINPGEAAILALGLIKDAPWVVDGQVAVRKVCHLAMSFDHRVVDGQQASRFLADVGALLSDPGLGLAF
jgi:2-oxoisovalerate dehydrogenase E2 component (dihydrolipoyl transacylase)